MWVLSALSRVLPLLLIVVVLGIIGAFLFGFLRSLAPSRPSRAERKQAQDYQRLIAKIRKQAYLWRDTDPTLSEFVLAEIETFETRENP